VELSRRRRLILKALVEEHVRSGLPVGSGSIVRFYGLAVSPATVRNELVHLEQAGLLTQPHTSAGRTPSDLGYRFYVDHLLQAPAGPLPEETLIRRYLSDRGRDVRNSVRATARFLADVTSYVSLVLTPEAGVARLRQVHMLPLTSDQALLVMVLDGGMVQHRLMHLPDDIGRADLDQLGRELHSALAGCTGDELPLAVNRLWRSSLARYGAALEAATQALLDALGAGGGQAGGERLYLGGTANILTLPEFQDVERLRSVLSLLEQDAALFEMLDDRAAHEGVNITIGTENPVSEIRSCSLVTATYRTRDGGTGVIGLLGPTRMDYGRVLALLSLAARQLDEQGG
jgi:heat-inducible transcriptional repressor